MFMFKKKDIDKPKARSDKKLNPGSNAQNGLETKLDKKTPKDSENGSKYKKFFNIKKLKIFSRFKNKDVPKGNNTINVNSNKQSNSTHANKLNSNKNASFIEEESIPYILQRDISFVQGSPVSKSSTKSEKSKSAILKNTKPKSEGLKGEKSKSDGLKSGKSESILSKPSLSLNLNLDKMSSSNDKIETQPKEEKDVILNSLDSKNSKINSKELYKNEKNKNSTIKEKLTLKKIFKSPFNNTSKNAPENNDANEITDLKEKFKHAKSIFDKKIASKKSINSSSSKSNEDHSENGIIKKNEIFNFLNKKKNEKNKNFFMKKKAGFNKNDPKFTIKKKGSNNANLLNREPSTNSIQHSTSTIMISGIKEKKNALIERANKIENNQFKISRDLNNTNDDLYVGNCDTNHIVNKQILFNVDPPLLFIENSFALCPMMPIGDLIEMIYSICEKNKDESIKKLNDCKENNQKISSTLMLGLSALDGEDESVISNLNKRSELQKQNLKEACDIVESIR
ncbi:conserved Plasmodium protein, unknown function [Plasmodium berghei]|uniref:Uncharacterized protein n=2 Tax=Plasmodium berghei TaxID=5821 RepID=A0A509AHH8_PLABA|nr:conserved Plasmodium protein, unknown function [Plasmodium berghei ANKA]CXI33175.1 conserved Plasmodium protein, unknown function [Plasmodium berghei]SCM21228.1 conserved Plasmodium protein, unknown function [Plasmodium berghei]SCN24535.1 conserved Plasmodium protein, unknown function [Plasmodium berghei]SCO59712.1 conserved Plasmodium protein, unknown function [Plasmodium berghei]SCO60924.1 conserved Plasmodium protein, unknown function [Plasmodium berghei]|eukprot:XP_034421168.1 conserved Plasmodium protein, unknown function [Plasmodium berghei ANKA]